MTQITLIGNLTDAPELRFTAQGKAVANFTVAVSKRIKDADGSWKDGNPTYWKCQIWDSAAENMTESLTKGMRVIAVGEANQRSYETREGEKRTVIEVSVSEVGPSLRWSTAKVEKANGSSKPAPKPADDPWSAAPAVGADEIPF